MASSVPVLLLSVCLFTTIVGYEVCGKQGHESKLCEPWKFCCGTCDEKYCCADPQKRLPMLDCLLKGFKELGKPPRRDSQAGEIIGAILSPLCGISLIVLIISCFVCPCCCLYKRCRRPRPVTAATTVVTTQYLLQPDVQGGRYLPYQHLPNNPPYGVQPMPNGPVKGQTNQEAAGPAYPVPVQPAQAALPTDYTLRQPPYNPAYVDLPSTTLATPIQSVN